MRIRLLVCSLLTLGLLVGAAPPDESVLLSATDDTYVVADVAAPDDPQGLRDKSFGGLDFLKIWYASQVQAQEQVVSVGLVKFDLSALRERDIRSAHLQLFAVRTDLLQPARLVDVSLADGPWTETETTFKGLPLLNTPLASTAVYGANVWYSWDVTPAVVRKVRDGSVAYAVGLRTLEPKGEEQVVFAAHESGRNAPRLVVTVAPVAPPIPTYALPIGIAMAALAAFAGGLLIGRRRWKPALTPPGAHAQAASITDYAPTFDELDEVIQCPSCQREIPSLAEVCPRCGMGVNIEHAEREAAIR